MEKIPEGVVKTGYNINEICENMEMKKSTQYKLTIPGRLPGLNELIEAERSNRYKGAQLKKDAERRICAEIRRQLGSLSDTGNHDP